MKFSKYFLIVCWFLGFSFQSFSQNRWELEASFSPSDQPPWSTESTLELQVDFQGIEAVTRSVFSLDGFEEFTLTGAFTVDIWSFYAELSFTPTMPDVFDHFLWTTALELPGLTIELTMNITEGGGSYSEVQLSSSLEEINIKLSSQFSLPKLQYESTDISVSVMSVSVMEVYCVGGLGFQIGFAKTGFQSLEVSLEGVSLLGPKFPSFDVSVDFTLTHKEVTLEVRNKEWEVNPCVKLYLETAFYDAVFSWVALNGIELKCSLGRFQFRSVTALNPSYALSLLELYKEGYWEMVELSLEMPTDCCGRLVNADFFAYFSENGSGLFGWAETARFLGLSSQTMDGGLRVGMKDQGLEELSVSLGFSW